MKKLAIALLAILCQTTLYAATQQVEQWKRFELSFQYSAAVNPFTDVDLSATFTNGSQTITVRGFYDGNDTFRIRFMPTETGTWRYITKSNAFPLSNQRGELECVPPTAGNHGMVSPRGWGFAYSDGTPYMPFGTTIYSLVHYDRDRMERTMKSLSELPFNKVRICFLTKIYKHTGEDDQYQFPYMVDRTMPRQAQSRQVHTWDFSRFNPEYFRRFEEQIDRMADMGIECDLILFHPYDGGFFGFDRMTRNQDESYLRYLVARLGSFRNVWWSLANEYDNMARVKHADDWEAILKTVVEEDPYRHMVSNHCDKEYYAWYKPEVTHVSIQDGSTVDDFGRCVLFRQVYKKPVIVDEMGYEGTFADRWGNLSGQEETKRFWIASISGCYATHGEVMPDADGNHTNVWSENGDFLRGECGPRIAFLRKLMEKTGAWRVIDNWTYHNIAIATNRQVIVYFGTEAPKAWEVMIPTRSGWGDHAKFTAELVDTWNMTITPVKGTFELKNIRYEAAEANGKKIKMPGKPYMALILTKVE